MTEQVLSHKTSQALVISKQMQQSLKILQMNSLELREFLSQETESNPFLEFSESDNNSNLDYNNSEHEPEIPSDWQEENFLRYERLSQSKSNDNSSSDQLVNKIGLKQHLEQQIIHEKFTEKERLIALYITDCLDDNGYLRENLKDIASFLKTSEVTLKPIIAKLKKLDPSGCYASNLEECIQIQLEEKKLLTPIFSQLISRLSDIAKGEVKKVARDLSLAPEELMEMLGIIRSLDPKPGRNFSSDSTRNREIDAFIFKDPKGEFKVRLNTQTLPSIFLNSKYYDQVLKNAKTPVEKKFCSEKMHNASWLLRSITQRSESILKVANQIIETQYEFLESGIDYLKPMTLSDIAVRLGVHESTISRLSNKVIATPLGVFEIKFFFTNSLSSNISENMISTLTVKRRIKELIENETKSSVLSDDEIAKALNDNGINISRRTVAKYREALQIAPSNIRKRLKKIA